jgi:NADH:ubiquinone oxidoreductase subunit
MKTFLLRFFTWWNGQTFGTQVWTWLYGEFVGTDEFGNRYYRTKGGKIDKSLGFERRWVTYNGYAEASTIPPAWHGWMHHMVDVPPTQERVEPRPWCARLVRPWRRVAVRALPATTSPGRRGANRADSDRR